MAEDIKWVDSMPEVYDRCLGPTLFAPFARELAARAAASTPVTLLELAAGTGILTAELVRVLPETRIVATDLNPAMVGWAAQRVAGPRWLSADAQRLDFPEGAFDLVVCQFGAMFFPDKAAAFAQARHVLRPGGRLLFAVWDRVETSPFPVALGEALAEMFPGNVPDFVARIPHGYHDAARIAADVAAGGLALDRNEHVVLRGRAPSAATMAEGFAHGTPLRFALAERGPLDKMAAQLAARMTARLGEGPIEGDIAAYVVSAHRPS
jgi:ubiquinone/menaquinone biosynthesis C-methylase UbiE